MSLVRRLLAQMDMHHAGAGVESCPGFARHFLRRYRNVMLLGVGEHAVQRAGDDSLVAHGWAFDLFSLGSQNSPADHASRDIPLLASTRYRPIPTAVRAAPGENRHYQGHLDRCGRSRDPLSLKKSRAAAIRRTS